MKQIFLTQHPSPHLLLFFAGWGMDETPFRQFHPVNCDWMVCYDYRSLNFDEHLLQGYTNITLIAWSMGVWIASQVMSAHANLPITRSIAINGTFHPIDETLGIAPSIFDSTLQGLNEQTLQKFQRRMCGSANDYQAFQTTAPQRPVEELKEELAAIREHYQSLPPPTFLWQKAIIGKADRIFLPENQYRAWKEEAGSIEQVEAAHYQQELFLNKLKVL